MVVSSNSNWVRPAQAIVYMESGKMRFFPPRHGGPVPRALTFHEVDWDENRDCNNDEINGNFDEFMMHHHNYYNQACHYSIMVAENSSTKIEVDDPPEEYKSFEHEYSELSVLKEADSTVDDEVPSMSTPTAQYTEILRHKRLAVRGPNGSESVHNSPSSASSGATTDCFSPLLQKDGDSFLPLNALIDLYTQKMQQARVAKSSDNSDDINHSNLQNGVDKELSLLVHECWCLLNYD